MEPIQLCMFGFTFEGTKIDSRCVEQIWQVWLLSSKIDFTYIIDSNFKLEIGASILELIFTPNILFNSLLHQCVQP